MKPKRKQYRKTMLSFHDEDEQGFGMEGETVEEDTTTPDLAPIPSRPAFRGKAKRNQKALAFSSRRSRHGGDRDDGPSLTPPPLHPGDHQSTDSWGEKGNFISSMTTEQQRTQSSMEAEVDDEEEEGLTSEERAMITDARKRRLAQRQGLSADYISLSSGSSSMPLGSTHSRANTKKTISLAASMNQLPSALHESDGSSSVSYTTDSGDDRKELVREALRNMYGDMENIQGPSTYSLDSPEPLRRPSSKVDIMGDGLEDDGEDLMQEDASERLYFQDSTDQARTLDTENKGRDSDDEELARWESSVIQQGGMMTQEGLDRLLDKDVRMKRKPTSPNLIPQPVPLSSFSDFSQTLDRACMDLKASIEETELSLEKHQSITTSLPTQQVTLNQEATQSYSRYLFYQETLDWVNDTVSMMELKVHV